ncbi:sensor histidine kinase [Mycolicibacterium doricum]|uniref:histidine kinase n=1 Tax=Mycolicibacterium doricum TaxID=126673 RepID=A0A1X1TKP7_9MYCO|nr:sensor histidine kinase [Mycolicibacterium doricum]MCV7267285.1 sensor histidine kinase [Mycolicibacterium doricum]ORV45049.1 histidine kinase [Mycolicibacterium doricum]
MTGPPKRPSWWSPANWPVRWKVLAIVLVPLILAGVLGGSRIAGNLQQAGELRLAAERAQLIPDINDYMAAMENVVVAATGGRETQSVLAGYDAAKAALGQQLTDADVVSDVRLAVNTLLDQGQDLIDEATANSVDLRQRVFGYGPLLLTAETAITGSARGAEQHVQLCAEALSWAVGARGQMAMQNMLVTRGGDVPEPELRAAMITVAGAEPSTVSGMAELLGEASEEANTLRGEMFERMSTMSDPAAILPGNPELLQSQAVTAGIADTMIADTTDAIPAAVTSAADAQRSAAFRDAVLILLAFAAAVVLVLLVARSLVRPLRRLRDSALKVAHEDLPKELDRVRAGTDPGPVSSIPVYTTEEIGQVAHAVDELHEQAVQLAGEQSRLQLQISDMFQTLSRRSRSLVDQQLSLIDRLERDEDDPQRLKSLFRLDHLAARMRRNGANLLVLSGASIARDQAEPVPVATIINAAASQVEDYTRVVTAGVPDSRIVGAAAGDLVHLLAELLDNALRYSPPISQVRVSAMHHGNGGLVVEVSDNGLGMAEADLRMANARLQSGGEVTPYTARHMGLFVVGRLAAQHGFAVRLRSTVVEEPDSGTTAGVYVPAQLLAHTAVTAQTSVPSAEPYAAAEPASQAPVDSSRHHRPLPAPTNTSAFFASRAQAAANGAHERPEPEPDLAPGPSAKATAGTDDAIYQSMLSEWLIDPTELGKSTDLDWKSVWDYGWSAAAAADEAAVRERTDEGLPVREPGARLVPGSGGRRRSGPAGGAHRNDDTEEQVASAAEADAPPRRDPEAIRASMSRHFGGVHAGRAHSRDVRGTEPQ